MILAGLKRWAPLAGGVMTAQAGVQVLNALSGFLLIRILPREDAYAWFTIASSSMLLINILSDPGATSSVQSLAGPVWQDSDALRRIIAAVRAQLRWVTGIAVVIAGPWMAYLLHHVQAPWWTIAAAAAVLVLGAWSITMGQVLSHINRLRKRYRPQLTAELINAATRLALTLTLVLPFAGWWLLDRQLSFLGAITASVAAAILYHQLLRRQNRELLTPIPHAPSDYTRAIRQTLIHTAPFTIYYAVQGHLSTWLITLFGSTAGVSDVGALGRLAVIFGVAGAPIVQMAMPSFARCTDAGSLRRQLFKVCALYGVFAVSILSASLLVPGWMLWLLGAQYAHLTGELPIAVLGLICAAYVGMLWGLVLARGWVKTSALIIPFGIAGQIVALLLLDVSVVSGALWFNVVISLPSILVACWILWRSFRQWNDAQPLSV